MMNSHPFRAVLAGLLLLTLAGRAPATSTTFTYQGRLLDNGLPTAGLHDFQFKIFNAVSGSGQLGPTLTNEDVLVTSGLFQVELDFGPDIFTGPNRWLEMSVRLGASTGPYTPLAPRQPINPVPYAMFSMAAQNAAASTNAQNAAIAQNAVSAQTAVNAQNAQNAVLAATASAVAWTNITGLPAGFADGIDDIVPYATGTGLVVTAGNTLNVLFGTNGVGTDAARADHIHLGQSWTGTVARGLSLVVSNGTGTNIGVWGQSLAATGAGVLGLSSSTNGTNYGVFGQSAGAQGSGVFGLATSATGVGVQAQGAGASNSIALTVANGGIRVRGAGLGTTTPLFVHRAAASNIITAQASITVINHPLCNGDSNAVLMVTPVYNPNDGTGANGVLNSVAVGVLYTGTNATYAPASNRWAVFNLGGTLMSAGAAFNVLIVKP